MIEDKVYRQRYSQEILDIGGSINRLLSHRKLSALKLLEKNRNLF